MITPVLRALCTICVLLATLSVCAQKKSTPPNIILILADDMGYADVQGYGAAYPTPNILKLQREGMKLTSFYAQPQCSPSRAALMTGCYPQRVGIPWVVFPEGPEIAKDKYFVGLHPDEQTLPELLKQRSYATACIGKWHLGHHQEHLPLQHGFDEYFGLPYSNDMGPEKFASWPALPLIDGNEVVEKSPDQSALTARYTMRALAFIDKHAGKPFFLYLAHTMPHIPIYASGQFKDKSGKGSYADVVQEIDWSVGEVMKALKKHKIDKHTLVIFTSDNGPWLRYGNHGGSAGIFREGKGTTFEGGVRVPMIARWPGHIKAGSSSDAVAALFDLLPTMVELTGVQGPSQKIDGKSFLPLLTGASASGGRDVHYYFQVNHLQAIRKGKWKLHLPHGYDHITEPGMDGADGKTAPQQMPLSLFDLGTDPAEANDVAAQHPDIVNELKQMAEDFDRRLKQEARQPGKSL
jgi:arylsulfatase